MKTKRLSLFLAIIMMLSVFSGMIVVNAENTYPNLSEADKTQIAAGNEWKIGDTYYADWAAATAAIEGGTSAVTLYLLTDTTESLPDKSNSATHFTPQAAVTIIGVTQDDGTKPVITSTGYRWFTVDTAQDVTVKNIEIVSSGAGGAIQHDKTLGSLTLVDMIVTNTVAVKYGVFIAKGTSFTMINSKIISNGAYDAPTDASNGSIIYATNGKITITGSEFINNGWVRKGIIFTEGTDGIDLTDTKITQTGAVNWSVVTLNATGTLSLNNCDINVNGASSLSEGILYARDNSTVNVTNSRVTVGSDVTGGSAFMHVNKDDMTINVENSAFIDENTSTAYPLIHSKGSNTGYNITLKNSIFSVSKLANNNDAINAITLKGSNSINGYTVTTEAADGIAYNATTTLLGGNEVLEGAAVRVVSDGNDGLDNSGLRFMSTVSAAAIEAAGANATYGTVIFRYSDYTAWLATNAGKTMADFIAAANANDTDDLKVVDIAANTGKVVDEDGNMTIYAALVAIKTANYGTDFGAVSYIKTADNTIVYSAFDAEKHVRSITEVATAALADTNATQGYEEDGYKYNYLVSEGVYSPYTAEQRTLLNKYLGN